MQVTKAELKELEEKILELHSKVGEVGMRLTEKERQEVGHYFFHALFYLDHAAENLSDAAEKLEGERHLRR